jgi:ribonuclease R
LRDRLILTIDPVRARDFDDALSLDRDGQGRLILGVHIADVCHYVLPGSALDKEAQKRGNSVYFPDRVIPMLPEQLSNGVCSLNPNVDRLAFSVFMTLDEGGAVINRRFSRSIIRSKHRLTYEQVMALLDQPARPKGGKAEPEFREILVLVQTLVYLRGLLLLRLLVVFTVENFIKHL